jgi:hypothetical protein
MSWRQTAGTLLAGFNSSDGELNPKFRKCKSGMTDWRSNEELPKSSKHLQVPEVVAQADGTSVHWVLVEVSRLGIDLTGWAGSNQLIV